MDDVILNLRNLGVKIWGTRALVIAERASVVREARDKLKGAAALQ
jgi:hypothetical protein